MDHLLLH